MIQVACGKFGSMDNNCFLITDEATGKSALVDCTDDSQKMMQFIANADLQYILLTHGHFDHIGGVSVVKAQTGAKVVISNEDEPMLSSSKKSLAAFCNAPHSNVTADRTVSDGDVIQLGKSEIKVISTPGHTKGSVCYLCDDKLFTGDTLFYCSCGRTDFPTGSSVDMAESLKRLASLDGDYTVYTGHNEISALNFERKNNPYMR